MNWVYNEREGPWVYTAHPYRAIVTSVDTIWIGCIEASDTVWSGVFSSQSAARMWCEHELLRLGAVGAELGQTARLTKA